MKKALIIGLTGQDGSFLAEFLLGKGYIIFGLVRKKRSQLIIQSKFLLKNFFFLIVLV
jgi:GDPmannose 4,6-dehydratase